MTQETLGDLIRIKQIQDEIDGLKDLADPYLAKFIFHVENKRNELANDQYKYKIQTEEIEKRIKAVNAALAYAKTVGDSRPLKVVLYNKHYSLYNLGIPHEWLDDYLHKSK